MDEFGYELTTPKKQEVKEVKDPMEVEAEAKEREGRQYQIRQDVPLRPLEIENPKLPQNKFSIFYSPLMESDPTKRMKFVDYIRFIPETFDKDVGGNYSHALYEELRKLAYAMNLGVAEAHVEDFLTQLTNDDILYFFVPRVLGGDPTMDPAWAVKAASLDELTYKVGELIARVNSFVDLYTGYLAESKMEEKKQEVKENPPSADEVIQAQFNALPNSMQNEFAEIARRMGRTSLQLFSSFADFLGKAAMQNPVGQVTQNMSKLVNRFWNHALYTVGQLDENAAKGIWNGTNDPTWLKYTDFGVDLQRVKWRDPDDRLRRNLDTKWAEAFRRGKDNTIRALVHAAIVLKLNIENTSARINDQTLQVEGRNLAPEAYYYNYLINKIKQVSTTGSWNGSTILPNSSDTAWSFFNLWERNTSQTEEAKQDLHFLGDRVPTRAGFQALTREARQISLTNRVEKKRVLQYVKSLAVAATMGAAGVFLFNSLYSKGQQLLMDHYQNTITQQRLHSVAGNQTQSIYTSYRSALYTHQPFTIKDYLNMSLSQEGIPVNATKKIAEKLPFGKHHIKQVRKNKASDFAQASYMYQKVSKDLAQEDRLPPEQRTTSDKVLAENRKVAADLTKGVIQVGKGVIGIASKHGAIGDAVGQAFTEWNKRYQEAEKILPLGAVARTDDAAMRAKIEFKESFEKLYWKAKAEELLMFGAVGQDKAEGAIRKLRNFMDWVVTPRGARLNGNLRGIAENPSYLAEVNTAPNGVQYADLGGHDLKLESREELANVVAVLHEHVHPAFPGVKELQSMFRFLLLFQMDDNVRSAAAGNQDYLFSASEQIIGGSLGFFSTDYTRPAWLETRQLFIQSMLSEGSREQILAQLYNWFGNNQLYQNAADDYVRLFNELTARFNATGQLTPAEFDRLINFADGVYNRQLFMSAQIMENQVLLTPEVMLNRALYGANQPGGNVVGAQDMGQGNAQSGLNYSIPLNF